jgi:uncharacterized protein
MDNFPALGDYILALLFGIVLPFVSGIKSAEAFKKMSGTFDSATKKRFYLGNSFFLFLIAAVVVVVWLLYGRPLSALGFVSSDYWGYPEPWWMIILFACLYLMEVLYSMYNQSELEETKSNLDTLTPFMPTKLADLPTYTVMCISAGVFEEIVFRGFMINFFFALLDGIPNATALALLLPAIIFSAAHYYQGPKAVFKILVFSLLFGMIFWQTRSLLTVIILHFLVDFIGGLLSVGMAGEESEEGGM